MPIPDNASVIRLESDTPRKPFDCGNDDLNEFFMEDSKGHSNELLAVTYAFETQDETIAYYCVANDSIRESDTSKRKFRKIILDKLHHGKRYRSHPAVKIGRFAVSNKHKKQGVGTMLMDYIKGNFIINNKTGCRFITVDAYDDAIEFYLKKGFDFLTVKDEGKDRRQMYFDLYPLSRDLSSE